MPGGFDSHSFRHYNSLTYCFNDIKLIKLILTHNTTHNEVGVSTIQMHVRYVTIDLSGSLFLAHIGGTAQVNCISRGLW